MRGRLLGVLLCGGGALWAQDPVRLTLAEAERMALSTRPAVSAAQHAAAAAAEAPAEYEAARYPTATANFTGAGAPANTRLAAGGINNPVIYSRVAGGVSVSQLLLDFGHTANLVAGARLRSESEGENSVATRSRTLIEVDRAYFSALRAEAVVRVAMETVRARKVVADQVSELAKARLKSGLDVTFANVSLGEANLLLSSAQNERQAAYANLAAAIGYENAPRFELTEEPFHLDPLAKDELLAKAMKERPDLRALELESAAEGKFARAEAANRYPSIAAFGFAGVIPEGASALRGNYTAAGLTMNLPFLNGGLYKARQTEAEQRALAARERARELETRIVRDVTVALLNVNTAAERVDLTAQLLGQATQALELAQSRYELGLSSIVELSQAQLAMTSAAIQQANAKYDYQIERSVLDYEAGLRR